VRDVVHGRVQQVLQLVFVPRRRNYRVRQHAQIGEVEHALVRLAIVADDPTTVQRKHHGQVLDTDVVNDLIVGCCRNVE